jgi:APA family basic amino acid/polyamine antiporter
MIVSLDNRTQLTAFFWMLIGLVIYFLYSRSHSNLNRPVLQKEPEPAGSL